MTLTEAYLAFLAFAFAAASTLAQPNQAAFEQRVDSMIGASDRQQQLQQMAQGTDGVPATALRRCDATAAQQLVGGTADEASLDRAKRLSDARSVRIVRPGQPQSMDFKSGRLNVDVDQSGRIVGFTCG